MVFSNVSRNVLELKEIPSKCFTCPSAIEIAEADVNPEMTVAEMKPVREPGKKHETCCLYMYSQKKRRTYNIRNQS